MNLDLQTLRTERELARYGEDAEIIATCPPQVPVKALGSIPIIGSPTSHVVHMLAHTHKQARNPCERA